ncbi:phosphoglycerate dehydrogenase [Mesorhizobium sp. DCY119]|uniref:phosphoglycerate dehydrogenase n=1 Tax=Mesorhizobium sp. DCY119 TaxID=2108445 RepID=UPI000E7298B7|nr:phosphoglycerate dehydrogenase [Mesorhizobium sp. DCY119]RJG40890.1 dihydrofolate reductase [Mesorhizobium sp. DCY119]
MNVLFTCHHLLRNAARFAPLLEARGVEVRLPEMVGQQFNAQQMIDLIEGADILIAGDDEITRDVLAAGKGSALKAIVKWGIGTDGIDKGAASEIGIPVYNTPGVFSNEVADLAFTFLLLLCRPLHKMHQTVAAGGWTPISGRTLSGLSAGIVGLGSIGRAIAARCAGFGITAKGSDAIAIPQAELDRAGVVEQIAFDELLETSDVIILACALTAENRHMLNDRAFASMKDGVLVINVGRGPLVDEGALGRALESGKVAGAGLDVFEVEPLPMDSKLRGFDNIIFGCHAGSNTAQAVERINSMTVGMTLQLLGHEPPQRYALNRVA